LDGLRPDQRLHSDPSVGRRGPARLLSFSCLREPRCCSATIWIVSASPTARSPSPKRSHASRATDAVAIGAERSRPRRGCLRRDAATRSALPTSLLLVQTSSRRPAAPAERPAARSAVNCWFHQFRPCLRRGSGRRLCPDRSHATRPFRPSDHYPFASGAVAPRPGP